MAEFGCLYSEVLLTRNAWEKRKFVQMLNNSDGLRRGPFGSALKKAFFVKESSFVVYEQQNAIYDRFNTRYRISEKKFAELHNFEVLPGDFLLSGAGTIGRIARVPKGIEQGVFNQALIRLRINESMTDSEFFLQFIRSDFMQKNLTETNPGSAIQNLVPMSELKNWTVRTPVVNEQRKIGSLLKKIDSLIAATQHKIDALEQAKKALLQRLFDQSWRFKGYSDPWEKRKLTELSKNKIGGGTPSTKFLDFWNGKLPWLQSSDINESNNYSVKPQKFISLQALKHSAAKRVPANSIAVVTRVGVGKLALIEYDYSTSQDFLSFSSLNWSALFSVNLLTLIMTQMSRESQGTSIKGVTKSELLAKKVRIPISLKEQEKLGILMKSINDLVAATQSRLSSLELLKKALLQDLFI